MPSEPVYSSCPKGCFKEQDFPFGAAGEAAASRGSANRVQRHAALARRVAHLLALACVARRSRILKICSLLTALATTKTCGNAPLSQFLDSFLERGVAAEATQGFRAFSVYFVACSSAAKVAARLFELGLY